MSTNGSILAVNPRYGNIEHCRLKIALSISCCKMRNDEGTLLVSHSSRGCLPAFADEALNVGASITFSESMKHTFRQTLPCSPRFRPRGDNKWRQTRDKCPSRS